MAWLGAALTGVGLLSGLFGKKKQVTDQTYSSSSTPNYDPGNLSFRNFLMKQFQDQLDPSAFADYQKSYTTGGLKTINTNNNQAAQAIQDMLAARGLGRTTAGAGTIGDVSLSGANQSSNFLNQIPIVMDQLKQQRLAGAASYQASLPVGTNITGSSHTEGTGGPSSPTAGLIEGGSTALAAYLGQLSANRNFADVLKAIGKTPTTPTTTSTTTTQSNPLSPDRQYWYQ